MMKAIIEKKQNEVNEVAELIDNSKSFIIFEYQGLNAFLITNLRKEIVKNEGKLKVLKNSILDRAFVKQSINEFKDNLVGPNAIAFSFGDEISVFKSIVGIAKNHDFIKIKGGFFNSKFVDVNEIKTIASIPGREGLYSMLLSCFTFPIRSVLYALKAIVDTKQG